MPICGEPRIEYGKIEHFQPNNNNGNLHLRHQIQVLSCTNIQKIRDRTDEPSRGLPSLKTFCSLTSCSKLLTRR